MATSEFAGLVREVEPRLLWALVSVYGPRDGREATVDALSWAWEHSDRLGGIDKLGYYGSARAPLTLLLAGDPGSDGCQ